MFTSCITEMLNLCLDIDPLDTRYRRTMTACWIKLGHRDEQVPETIAHGFLHLPGSRQGWPPASGPEGPSGCVLSPSTTRHGSGVPCRAGSMNSYLVCFFCPFNVSVPEAQPSRAASLGSHVFAPSPSPCTFNCTRVQLEAANWQSQEAQLSSRPPWPVQFWTAD